MWLNARIDKSFIFKLIFRLPGRAQAQCLVGQYYCKPSFLVLPSSQPHFEGSEAAHRGTSSRFFLYQECHFRNFTYDRQDGFNYFEVEQDPRRLLDFVC